MSDSDSEEDQDLKSRRIVRIIIEHNDTSSTFKLGVKQPIYKAWKRFCDDHNLNPDTTQLHYDSRRLILDIRDPNSGELIDLTPKLLEWMPGRTYVLDARLEQVGGGFR